MKMVYLILFAAFMLVSCSAKDNKKQTELPDNMALASSIHVVEAKESSAVEEAPEELSELVEEETEPPIETKTKAEEILAKMSVEEKLGQLFICAFRKDAFGSGITGISPEAIEAVEKYHIGGVVLFRENIASQKQTAEYISNLQMLSNIPLFIGVDEEGGIVRRTQSLEVPSVGSQFSIAKEGEAAVYSSAKAIAEYLTPMGFNLNFAPVADIFSNPSNTVIAQRAYGTDEKTVSSALPYAVKAYNEAGMVSVLKHFPGHGDTLEDSHYGLAFTRKALDELREMELKPFAAGIEAGAPMVMAGHICAPNITDDNEPAIFSHRLITEILRGEMGFSGIVITDAMDMGALNSYSAEESALKAFEAGVDILLMPPDYKAAYSGLLEALLSGEITSEQLDEKVLRILECKEKFMLLDNYENLD